MRRHIVENERAVFREVPKRFWKNLAEAAVIPALLQQAPRRERKMITADAAQHHGDEDEWHPAPVPETRDLSKVRAAALRCTACPLYKNATQTVFGAGSPKARIIFVGEQPGDREDREGQPFIGPAGKLLDRAFDDAGIDRSTAYVTNAVKHFKWEPRGKRRLHKTPNGRDIAACRPWLEAELKLIKPRVLVCLGGTAVKSVLGPAARVLRDRGQIFTSDFCEQTVVTVHPSSLLRAPDEASREKNYALFIEDLKVAARLVANR